MTVETTTRPFEAPMSRHQEPPRPQQRRRRRALAVLGGAAGVTLGTATLVGSGPLEGLGALFLVALAVYVGQVLRLRAAAVRRELDALVELEWSAEDLAGWPSLAGSEGMVTSAATSHPHRTTVRRRARLMDRWSFTQVLWAGVLGCCYNAVASLAERLAAGSSLPRVRSFLLEVTGQLLARLSRQSLRRTVAISALATASGTSLFVTGAGLVGTTAAGAAEVSASHRATTDGQGVAAARGPGAATAAQAPAASPSTYTVRSGDTLWGIAQRFGTTVATLAGANGIADPTLIFPGQALSVPAAGAGGPAAAASTAGPSTTAQAPAASPSTYTVRSGDTLWGIAQRFGTTVATLAGANGIAHATRIYVGKVLTIAPAGSATLAAAAAPSPAPSQASATPPAPAPAPAQTPAAPSPAPSQASATPPASTPSTPSTPSTYTVQPGDTLADIARRFGTTVASLAAANGIADPTVVYAGQVLKLSGSSGASSGTSGGGAGSTATLASASASPAGGAASAPTSASAPASTGGAASTGGSPSSSGAAALQAAESQLGVPYAWGGETPGVGFDCSGLAQWVWGQAGVSIPRTSQAQWTAVPHVSTSNLQPGDLLFYYNLDGTGTVDHVAIYVGSGPYGSQTIIQAPYTGATVSYTALYTTGLIGAGRP